MALLIVASMGMLSQPESATASTKRSHAAQSVPARTGLDDGNDGLAALQRGDFEMAIRLFTLALQPGRLTTEDAAFAHVKRSEAYAAKNQFDEASDDLKAALILDPSDNDARVALTEIAKKKSEHAFQLAMAPLRAGANPWGLLSAMVGHCYWVQVGNGDPHGSYARFVWLSPQAQLGFQIRSKTQQIAVGEYSRNSHSGMIIYSSLAGDSEYYGTTYVGQEMVADYGYQAGSPTRDLISKDSDAVYIENKQVYKDHSWYTRATARLVEAKSEDLIAGGFLKPKRTCP